MNKYCYVILQHEIRWRGREDRHYTASLETQTGVPDYLLQILVDELK